MCEFICDDGVMFPFIEKLVILTKRRIVVWDHTCVVDSYSLSYPSMRDTQAQKVLEGIRVTFGTKDGFGETVELEINGLSKIYYKSNTSHDLWNELTALKSAINRVKSDITSVIKGLYQCLGCDVR